MILTYIAIGVVTLLLYVKWQQSYWKRKGVPSIDFHFFFGHLMGLFFGQRSIGEMVLDRYNAAKALDYKHAGFYYFWKPVYMPFDPMIIKYIMQQDANHFSGHGLYHHPKDILSMNLFALEGERWRDLRVKLTPTFTSGKIKMMFETLAEKTEGLKSAVDRLANNEEGFVIKQVCGNFTTDVIASCAFGIECDSLADPSNVFRMYGKKMMEPKLLTLLMETFLPWDLLANLGFKETGRETSDFFINTVRQTIRSREDNEIYRKDFMHLMLQLKNQGTMSDSTKVDSTSRQKNCGVITEEDIIAQCFVFFLAGFETSSTTMTFALLELAQNLDIQEKLRQEIDSVLAKHNGKFSYESVAEMHYLEAVINETLRKFPPVPIIPRVCTQTYQLPNSNVILEKGTSVEIPVWGIHMDPDYYPDPDIFDPERFTEENKAQRKEFTFLPFGAGPRLCIGLRFGMIQSKMGLATLIRNFRFTLNKKTPLPLQMEHGVGTNTVKENVWVNAIRIENK